MHLVLWCFERDTSHSFVRVRRLFFSLVVSSGTRCCVFPFPRSPQRHPKLYPRPTAHGAATPPNHFNSFPDELRSR
jgi:hypothetical protein